MKLLLFSLITLLSINLSAQNQSIMRDDFDNNAKNWTVKSETDYGSALADGHFSIWLKKETWTWYIYQNCQLDPNKAFTLATEFKFKSGSEKAHFGLAWNVIDQKNNLVFELGKDGQYAIYERKEDKVSYIKNWTKSGKSIAFDEYHTLSVKYTGSEYEYVLDGEVLFRSPYSKVGVLNYVGFFIENKANALVNWIDVKQERGKLNTIDDGNFKQVDKENLGSKINTIYTEKRPIISSDGKTLYFTREGDPKNIGDANTDDIWVADLGKDGLWGAAYNIGRPLNNADNNSMVGVASDNSWMVLKAIYTPEGEYKAKGFSISKKVDGKWSVPEPIEVKNFYNKNKYQEAHINPDGTVLIFTIERDDTYGGKDIYFSKKMSDGTWSEPKNCGAVLNSFGDEIGPFMAGDGKTLYFASEGHPGYGDADIFMSKRLDDSWTNWSTPVNLGPTINTSGWDAYFSTDIKGEWGYMVSNQNSIGKLDIFRFKLPEKAKPEISFIVKGIVYNANTQTPMIGKIQFKKLENDSLVADLFTGGVDGKFELLVKEGTQYAIIGEYPGFVGESITVDFTGLEETTEKVVTINLKPIQKEQTIDLNNIFFAPDKAEILYTSRAQLSHVANLMKEHPNMIILIGGHTMSVGMTEKQNIKLSEKRAKAVYDYLIDLGISKKRLKYKGYGSSKPVYEDKENEDGTKNANTGNRCVSFTILSM